MNNFSKAFFDSYKILGRKNRDLDMRCHVFGLFFWAFGGLIRSLGRAISGGSSGKFRDVRININRVKTR